MKNFLIALLTAVVTIFCLWFLMIAGKDFGNLWLTAIVTVLLAGIGLFLLVKKKYKALGIGLIIGPGIHALVWIYIFYELSNHGW